MPDLSDSQGIFQQLAETQGDHGVKVVIENHDAWLHDAELEGVLGEALRMRMSRVTGDAVRAARIEQQRRRLAGLVVPLRKRMSSAG